MNKKAIKLIASLSFLVPASFALSSCGSTTGVSDTQLAYVDLSPSLLELPVLKNGLEITKIIDPTIDEESADYKFIEIYWMNSSLDIFNTLVDSCYTLAKYDNYGNEKTLQELKYDIEGSSAVGFSGIYKTDSGVFDVYASFYPEAESVRLKNDMALYIMKYSDDFDVEGSDFDFAFVVDEKKEIETCDEGQYYVINYDIAVESGKTYYFQITGFIFFDVAINTENYTGTGKIQVYQEINYNLEELVVAGGNAVTWLNDTNLYTITETDRYYVSITSSSTMNITLSFESDIIIA